MVMVAATAIVPRARMWVRVVASAHVRPAPTRGTLRVSAPRATFTLVNANLTDATFRDAVLITANVSGATTPGTVWTGVAGGGTVCPDGVQGPSPTACGVIPGS